MSILSRLAPEKGRMRITALKAEQMKGCAQCLVKLKTDARVLGV